MINYIIFLYFLLLTQLLHWLEREIDQWVHHEGSIQQLITPLANALTTELHLAPKSDSIHATKVKSSTQNNSILFESASTNFKRYY